MSETVPRDRQQDDGQPTSPTNQLTDVGDAEQVFLTDTGGNSAVGSTRPNLPQLVHRAGRAAEFAWEEFIFGHIRNPHTRLAYEHAIRLFLKHSEQRGRQLEGITPSDVGQYLDRLRYAPTTKKLHLAALRHFFDILVTRHVVVLNPAACVRGERIQVLEGKTPEIGVESARRLLRSINVTHVVGLRDRAMIALLIYTAARVGAVCKLRRGDFYLANDQYCLRLAEKGGKHREIPVRHDLRQYVAAYLAAGSLEYSDKASPLFRTAYRRSRQLTQRGMTAGDVARMVKRHVGRAGLSPQISPHSFRVTTITDLLLQGVSLGDVQNLAGHADPRTTRLYDRRHRTVTRNIVERISI